MPYSTDTFAEIAWEPGDTPRSKRFDDPYFAREDGRAETRHVFIAANGLPERWTGYQHFTIAETGFGTGLNFLETLMLWQTRASASQHLTFVSFERYPMSAADMERALSHWPDLQPLVTILLADWPPPEKAQRHAITFGNATLELHLGDANATLPQWPGRADCWFLDGFSPAKNPELWNAELLGEVFKHTAPGGTFATYTAAGFVRRNLMDAGFDVAKIPGFGRKRESLAGHRAAA